jgi:NAD(P)-dependent dehydrogenase (short-subunit alcohol dehydrogenase family)
MERQVLKDRIAIITGAARGLGEGIARAMAREGARTVLFSRNIELLKKLEKDIRASGQTVVYFPVDVTQAAQVNQAIKKVAEQFGSVDILVNNAAVALSMPFVEMPDEVRDGIIDTNIKGVCNCTRAVLPGMIERRYGKIINISSVTGPRVSNKGLSIYSASKGAVSALTKALALEVAEYGINVNAILPGSFDTPMMRSMASSRGWDSEDAYIKEVGKEIPLGRLGTMDEAGDLAVFLASEASTYITGTEIVIDGGNIIQEHK